MRQAVFLDRDGTLIEEHGFIGDTSDVVFYPETVETLQRLEETFELFIVTNQAGVGEGVLSLHEVDLVNGYITEYLEKRGINITALYVCPHKRMDACSCRKPNPYFLYQAAREYCVDLSRSYVIGDHPSDVELAQNAGAQGVYVLTGHGHKHRWELTDDVLVAPGIEKAAGYILCRDTSHSSSQAV